MDQLDHLFTMIRKADGSLQRVAELIEATRAFCATWDEYDRKSSPANLRKLMLARNRMRQIYRGEIP